MTFDFWMEDAERATALAIGSAKHTLDNVPSCPFMAGDQVIFAGPPVTVYVVVRRHYNEATQRWGLEIAASRQQHERPTSF